MKLKRKIICRPAHIDSLKKNLEEIQRILEIHSLISGSGRGYKHNVQVLNKSAIVLLLACWEAYVEDLAKNSFQYMLSKTKEPTVFPDHVLAIAGKEIKKSNNDIWKLANSGWKSIMEAHKESILEKYIVRGSFNTPNPKNIDSLFSNLIGYTSISSKWYWKGMSFDRSKEKLNELIELRGNIAHRVVASKKVTKAYVMETREFTLRLAIISNNRITSYLEEKIGKKPWKTIRYKKTR